MEILLFLILLVLGWAGMEVSTIAERLAENRRALQQISYQLSRFHPKEEVSDEVKMTFHVVSDGETTTATMSSEESDE